VRVRNWNGKEYTTGEPGDHHDVCIVAVHKKTGQMFGGKGKGTHMGYPKMGYLKTAMTNAGITDKSQYRYVKLSFNEVEGQIGLPTLTMLNESGKETIWQDE
jgi:hypothetical protein